jgi:hypothetical protein
MPASIYIYCPPGKSGIARADLEYELEEFFGGAAEDCGAGSGKAGFNLDFELEDGEDPDAWADRLKAFLQKVGVRPGTFFTVYPDGWEEGMEWRNVEVFGRDRRMTKPDPK